MTLVSFNDTNVFRKFQVFFVIGIFAGNVIELHLTEIEQYRVIKIVEERCPNDIP